MSEPSESSGSPKAPKAVLPPELERWRVRAVSLSSALPRPLKIFIVSTMVCAALIAGWFNLAPVFVDYNVLYSELERDDAGAVVESLKTRKVNYRLSGDGTTIEVPEDQIHELRLALANEGLPRGGHQGFESFQNMRIGATEFEQQVTYRAAMEGELARTIASMRSVRSARVHLVMPKKSVFSSRNEPATASVIVKLGPAANLDAEQVKGIVHLVSSAVRALEPERITLVTNDGRILHRPRSQDSDGNDVAVDGDQLARMRAYEAVLEDRTRSMLENTLGRGHVDVRVRAQLDSAKVEKKSDLYNRDTTALRSERLQLEGGGKGQLADDTVAGVPGAESNVPTGTGDLGAEPTADGNAPLAAGVHRSHTRNWEVDHVQERRVSVTHDVKRLAVAVVVDGVTSEVDGKMVPEPRSQEELDKLAGLVRSTVGFDEKRGDVLTIESVPFHEEVLPDMPKEPELLPIPEKYQRWVPLATRVAMGLAILVVILLVRRSLKRSRAERALALAESVSLEAEELLASEEELSIEAEAAVLEDPSEAQEKAIANIHARALERARDDPPSAALVVRHWLGTAGVNDSEEESA